MGSSTARRRPASDACGSVYARQRSQPAGGAAHGPPAHNAPTPPTRTVEAVQGVEVIHCTLTVQDEGAAGEQAGWRGGRAGCEGGGGPFPPEAPVPPPPSPLLPPPLAHSPLVHFVVGRAGAPPDVGLAVGLAHHALVPARMRGREGGEKGGGCIATGVSCAALPRCTHACAAPTACDACRRRRAAATCAMPGAPLRAPLGRPHTPLLCALTWGSGRSWRRTGLPARQRPRCGWRART